MHKMLVERQKKLVKDESEVNSMLQKVTEMLNNRRNDVSSRSSHGNVTPGIFCICFINVPFSTLSTLVFYFAIHLILIFTLFCSTFHQYIPFYPTPSHFGSIALLLPTLPLFYSPLPPTILRHTNHTIFLPRTNSAISDPNQ